MPKPHLVSLEEHNAGIQQLYRDWTLDVPEPNGVACPMCGTELMDTHPAFLSLTNPPQKAIHCRKCSYKGHRLA